MKMKYLVGMVIIIAVGGYAVYKLLNKKDSHKTSAVSKNECFNQSEVAVEESEEVEQENDDSKHDDKGDTTINQVYKSMSERNEMAKLILNDIHDDMKKSEENIATKKADIEKLMKNLKK